MSEVPDGWLLKTIGDLSTVKRGASPRPIKNAKWWGGSIGWVRISDVTSSRKYLTRTTQNLSSAGVQKSVQISKGEVILSICATIGRPIIVCVDACIHDGFVWFDKLDDSINREFWYYFLSDREEFLKNQRQSGAQGNLNTGIVSELVCALPPLPEQQKIASILSSVDKVIEKTEAQINKLQDLKKGMMQELLTKGIGHTEFKDSPVGRIPESWDVISLSQALNSLIDCEHKTAPYADNSKYLVVRTSNVRNGELDFKDIKCTTKEGYKEWTKRSIPKKGDILFTREAPAGESCLVPENREICLGQRMVLLRLEKTIVKSSFLSWYLVSEVAQKGIYKLSIGTTVGRINIEDINKIKCLIPSLDEQKRISNIIDSTHQAINSKKKKQTIFLKLKKALMQDLLTGKVRVTVDNRTKVPKTGGVYS